MSARLFTFVGGDNGPWRVVSMDTVVGDALADARSLNIVDGATSRASESAKWRLRGVTSNDRYITRQEKAQLVVKQPGLDRPEAGCAALIPIRKTASWWNLTQDERRAIFEESSNQIGRAHV